MESNLYYPSLRTLHKVVDAAMLTTLATSSRPSRCQTRSRTSTLAADRLRHSFAPASPAAVTSGAGCYTLTRSRPRVVDSYLRRSSIAISTAPVV